LVLGGGLIRLLQFAALAGNLGVHGIRRKINFTRPRHGSFVNEDLSKESFIPQRREGTSQPFLAQAHTPCQAVLESDKEAVLRLWFHFDYVPIHLNPELRYAKGVEPREREILAAELPRFSRFLSMYHRPFQTSTRVSTLHALQ
jgi:hypothetical protein